MHSLNTFVKMAVESADNIKVYYAPNAWRPCQADQAFANSEDDKLIVLSAGKAFMYVIPSLMSLCSH